MVDSTNQNDNSNYDAPQPAQSSGGGCLGSVAGIIKFIAFLALVAFIVFMVKCGC